MGMGLMPMGSATFLCGISAILCAAVADAAPVDTSPFVAHTIVPQVHLLAQPTGDVGPAVGNVVVVEQSDGLVLVDSGASIGQGRTVAAYIRSITSKPVKAVVLTHWHNDHPLGIAGLMEFWPHLQVIATPQTKAGMLSAGRFVTTKPSAAVDKQMYARLKVEIDEDKALLARADTPEDRRQRLRRALQNFESYYASFRGSYLVLPTRLFTRHLHLGDAMTPIDVYYFGRANTAGDVIVWLPRQKIVATGDIVVFDVPFGINSYPRPWLATLNRIRALGFRTLIPGHGDPLSGSGYLDKIAASISVIRQKVEGAARRGLSLAEIKRTVDLSSEVRRFGTTAYFAINVPPLWTDPMTVNAYKEEKGLPILQQYKAQPEPR